MSRIKVMISSTINDLNEERQTIDSVIQDFNYEHFRSEKMDSKSRSSKEVCDEMARDCDIYILIIGKRYGWIIPDFGISVVEREYDIAKESNPEKILVFIKYFDEDIREQREKEFMEKVTDFNTGYFRGKLFKNCEELQYQVRSSLTSHINEIIQRNNLSPLDVLSLSKFQRYQSGVIFGIIFILITFLLLLNSYIKYPIFPTFESIWNTISIYNNNILLSLAKNLNKSIIGFIIINILIITSMVSVSYLPKQTQVILSKTLGTIFFLISGFLFLFWRTIFSISESSLSLLPICGMIYSFYLFDFDKLINNQDASLKFPIKNRFLIITMNYIINRYIPFQVPLIYLLLFFSNLLLIGGTNENSLAGFFYNGILEYRFALSYIVILSIILIMGTSKN